MFSKWFYLQLLNLLVMVGAVISLSYYAELLQELFQTSVLNLPGSTISFLLFVTFFTGGIYLITFFQERKAGSFVSRFSGKRAPVILLALIGLAAGVMAIVFTGISLPLNAGIESRWAIDSLAVFFIILFCLLTLSVLVQFKEKASSEAMIHK
ncbi:hypothetical protein [Jeotgalibacillus proteolyticus]|uniref:Uncharacterized protein n=1 Tax=Jeotgalibacillus proteolyticus TaxID=2082395 RepID=A0A2S5GAE9_9BACL|nr:hypothetical protein [Jeotgalibacillus proteolyticus]PPA69895.1 hypothetical protein C4B60_15320 [Jeotgalibacillus proteolyticus]